MTSITPRRAALEIHAARIAERWAAAGIDVQLQTSRAPDAFRQSDRDGYRTVRPAGRYLIFPATVAAGLTRRRARPDGVVEIWNGMPFLSPLWAPHPRVTFLHHVHGGMWVVVLPSALAGVGKLIERRLAPPFYAGTPVVTLSESSRQTIIETLGLAANQITVVPPGVDTRFQPAGPKHPTPLVVAVGRLVPHKRFDLLIELLARVRTRHPQLQAVVAGEGSERPRLEGLVRAHRAEPWLHLAGRVDDDVLVDLYRRAWTVLSTSAYEGWGLTLSEAAACGTPAVASRIDGHLDAVVDGQSGLLAEPGPEMEAALDTMLTNSVLRQRLKAGAQLQARSLSWDRTVQERSRCWPRTCGAGPGRPGNPARPESFRVRLRGRSRARRGLQGQLSPGTGPGNDHATSGVSKR